MSDLEQVARRGDRLKSLEALRDYLARSLDETESARDRAALAARFADVLAQIDELAPPVKEVDPLASLVIRPSVGTG